MLAGFSRKIWARLCSLFGQELQPILWAIAIILDFLNCCCLRFHVLIDAEGLEPTMEIADWM